MTETKDKPDAKAPEKQDKAQAERDAIESERDAIESGAIVLPEYEQQIAAATAAADAELVQDLQDDYHDARDERLKQNRARAERAKQREAGEQEGA